MTYGIDIYDRYQDITNKLALRDSVYDFVYIKGTDGGGPASVRPDLFVDVIRSIGLPCGLYHYAQLSPTPEVQAEVLAAAIARTGARDLPPALDLEDPHPATFASRAFAERFLIRLVRLGFHYVTLYANTTMLNAIRAWELHDVIAQHGGELLIWAANYGNNDGAYTQSDANRLLAAYPHPVWIHQYSSTITVPGVPGNVDGNKMLHPLGEDDMAFSQEKIRFWQDAGGPLGEAAGWYEISADTALGWIHNYSQGANRNAAVAAANTQAILLAVTGDEFDEERYRTILGEELDKRPNTVVFTDAQFAALAEKLEMDEETVKQALAAVLREGIARYEADTPGDTPA